MMARSMPRWRDSYGDVRIGIIGEGVSRVDSGWRDSGGERELNGKGIRAWLGVGNLVMGKIFCTAA